MGEIAKGKTLIELDDLVTMFEVSLERIRLLGKAKVGDKTLVDALEPAVRSLRESTEQKLEMLPALEAAAQAANHGCESTRDLVAKHGKARYLGEQTLGPMLLESSLKPFWGLADRTTVRTKLMTILGFCAHAAVC